MNSRSAHRAIWTPLLVSGVIAFATGCAPPGIAKEFCVAGTVQARACGTCNTGEERHVCTADGTFEVAFPCTGVDETIPIDPRTLAPICGPYERPVVFFAPHPDDESIGMAGAIRESLGEGRAVFVELMTHGEMSRARHKLDDGGTDPWHTGSHHYNLSVEEFGDARVREFFDTAVLLGVTGVRVHGFKNGGLTEEDVSSSIQDWIERARNDGGTKLSLRGTAGAQDPQNSGGLPHVDHKAVWDALTASGAKDVQGYCIYNYVAHKSTPDETHDISPWCADKRAALEAYKLWDPDAGRFAVGEHSVPDVLANAASECNEFIVYPPNP